MLISQNSKGKDRHPLEAGDPGNFSLDSRLSGNDKVTFDF